MPKSVFSGVRISGVAGAVPATEVNNLTDHAFVPPEDRKKIVDLTRVGSYRKAGADTCASDLCQAAAERLLGGLGYGPDTIEAIVFATMTPDYRVPSTACLLQDRLKCRSSVVAYDINMGCSGFVVGLYNACALITGAGLKRVLLLAGDTQTKLCASEDKKVVFILGDGGTATLLEADSAAEDIVIELMTDGSRFQNLYVPAGGFRRPSTDDTREIRQQADGNMRSDDHLFMNGMEIFKFSATDVVKSLASFMAAQDLSPDRVGSLYLHQANWFMNDKIAKKLKFPPEKVPYTIQFYGNTGSASIPLTMAHHLSGNGSNGRSRALACGFGVGLSWGVASAVLDGVYAPPIVEIN
ncbi:MAG TPA: ketoacyl-ACP synthase III [Vicinamibacterales bacterium]|nr:ketoacyl-ACP synthase III [Vicinamibacterales bacterium]